MPPGTAKLGRTEGELPVVRDVRKDPDLAVDVPDDQVDLPVAIPVSDGDRARQPDAETPAVVKAELLALRVLPLAEPAKHEEVAGVVRAGDDVRDPVHVEVRELRTEADASPRRDARVLLAGSEPGETVELGLLLRADVLVDAQLPLAELPTRRSASRRRRSPSSTAPRVRRRRR
jgi:hypothetical protein